jgi:hypothetical protein
MTNDAVSFCDHSDGIKACKIAIQTSRPLKLFANVRAFATRWGALSTHDQHARTLEFALQP